MAAHARLKNEFTEDEKYHNLMTRQNIGYRKGANSASSMPRKASIQHFHGLQCRTVSEVSTCGTILDRDIPIGPLSRSENLY